MTIQLTENQLHHLMPNAVIQTNEGLWLRTENETWIEMFPHCADCGRAVTDTGGTTSFVLIDANCITTPAWEFFKEITVLAIPLSLVQEEWKK